MNVKLMPKVLYIEDSSDARLLVRRVLEEHYLLLEANEPIKGIELARDTEPDLILLDINLPNMTGIDVAIRLRSILKPGTPIVAVTADVSPGARERALAAGFAGFMTKPINVDKFESSIKAFLAGKREHLFYPEKHLRAYQSELVERFEARVRELTDALSRNTYLSKQNELALNALVRRQHLLEAGARVSHEITSILELDMLLSRAVDIICNEFELYYSGIFLLSDDGRRLELHAGYGQPGAKLMSDRFSLELNEGSMVGTAVLNRHANLALDAGDGPRRFKNPHLPDTRSEMALPLMFKDEPLGALTVQSADANAFSEEDATALQSLANQIAIAIHNARLVRRLDAANQEIIRSKTFEAIATATGEAIHWVGNKAAPVPASVQRVREDLLNIMAVFKAHLDANEPETKNRFLSVIENVFTQAQDAGIDLSALMDKLSGLPDNRLSNLIGLDSILEDLQIIENSAKTILNIKEDLLGPARQRNPVPFSLADEIKRIIANMRIPGGVVIAEFESELPPVYGDPRQLDQVYNNLIKNAWEALESNPDRRIYISVRRDPESGSLISCVRDNGPGIPPKSLEKIWVSFYTTKMGKGGTGLGLSACMEIVRQNGGSIWVESKPGQGAAFFVRLPVAA